VLWIDLLEANTEALFQTNPDELINQTAHLKPKSRVVIDEIQKVPKLLDLVHKLIEEKKLLFSLTGSSARKLKRGAANLLAGRAFVYNLFPFTSTELNQSFELSSVLEWGSLPKVSEFKSNSDKKKFLQSYAHTYIKEEIQNEQIVRNLPAFRRFIDVASQMNGCPLNYSKIGRDINTDHSVIRSFYEILEDTLVGFFLPAYDLSIRKQVRKTPKFYLFDTGVKRALDKTLDIPLKPQTYEYGKAFEHFIILEFYKLCKYKEKDETLFYLLTKNNLEIDLVIKRPGKKTLFIEIKSTTNVKKEDAQNLYGITKEIKGSEAFVLSLDKKRKTFEHIKSYYWKDFIDLFAKDNI